MKHNWHVPWLLRGDQIYSLPNFKVLLPRFHGLSKGNAKCRVLTSSGIKTLVIGLNSDFLGFSCALIRAIFFYYKKIISKVNRAVSCSRVETKCFLANRSKRCLTIWVFIRAIPRKWDLVILMAIFA